jgi:hypothetical protein
LAVTLAVLASTGDKAELGVSNEFPAAREPVDMTIEHLPHSTDAPPIITFEAPECLTVASCKRKLAAYWLTEIRLRGALARNEILLRQ